jgi:hypothetical protein
MDSQSQQLLNGNVHCTYSVLVVSKILHVNGADDDVTSN